MIHSIRNFKRGATKLLAARASGFALSAVICLPAIPHLAFSADKPKGPEISRVIAKEMDAAQKALKANQWAEVIKDLEAAEQKSPLTTFDKNTIYDFKAYAYIKLNNMKAAQAAYEQAIATGGYTPEQLVLTNRKLFAIAANSQQLAKAIEYGKAITESSTATPADFANITQLYYQQKDCKNEVIWADKSIAAYRKAGEQPKEQLYQFKMICASDAGDDAAIVSDLYELIRLTNKSSYWNNLIVRERQNERDEHNLLMIYRVMYDTNSMTMDSDYIEMAQLLADGGLPGEAAAVLDKATSAGQIKDEHNKERVNRFLTAFKTRAEADKKTLSQQDAEAEKNPAGQLAVKVGEVYYGFGDYAGATKLISAGLQKEKVKDLDEAYVYLARSYVAQKNNADAKKALSQLKTVPNISPRVLKLWELYADKLGQTTQ